MFRVIEIGLVDGRTLPFVDRAGVAVAEALVLGAVETDHLAVDFGKHASVFDVLDGADAAVVEAELLVGLEKLDAVAGGKGEPAVGAVELVILAELPELAVHLARAGVELAAILVGVGEDEPAFVGCGVDVAAVGVEQFGAGLGLGCASSGCAPFGLIDAERVVKFPLGEILAGAAVVAGGLPLISVERRRAVAVFENAEHAAALDARRAGGRRRPGSAFAPASCA